jgi:hypothetical protein
MSPSLIAAALLYQFGTGSIRGFATTLTLGLVANIFTAVFVSRTLFEITLRGQVRGPQSLGFSDVACSPDRNAAQVQPLGTTCAVRLGACHCGWRGGDDVPRTSARDRFRRPGTAAVVEFESSAVTVDDVRQAVAPLPGDEIVQRYGPACGPAFPGSIAARRRKR